MNKVKSRWFSSLKIKLALLSLSIVAVAAGLYAVGLYRDAHPEAEVDRIIELLELRPGMTAAEIGAGEGRMSVIVAKRLGPTGQLYSTELDPERRREIHEAIADAGLETVTVVEAGERQTNLPDECCDAIFMSKVYHHFTDPTAINASLFQALRPGGLLAVIDFAPRFWRFWLPRPRGVPEDRGGHGMPSEILVEEMTAAGFMLERVMDAWWSWPEERYCVVFRKPA